MSAFCSYKLYQWKQSWTKDHWTLMMKIRNMGDCLVGAICAPQGCDTVPDAVHPDDVSFLHFYVGPETENPRNTFSGSPWQPGVQLRQGHGKGLVWDLEIVIKGKATVSPPAVADKGWTETHRALAASEPPEGISHLVPVHPRGDQCSPFWSLHFLLPWCQQHCKGWEMLFFPVLSPLQLEISIMIFTFLARVWLYRGGEWMSPQMSDSGLTGGDWSWFQLIWEDNLM